MISTRMMCIGGLVLLGALGLIGEQAKKDSPRPPRGVIISVSGGQSIPMGGDWDCLATSLGPSVRREAAFGWGSASSNYFLYFEYLPGISLTQYTNAMRKRQLPQWLNMQIFDEIEITKGQIDDHRMVWTHLKNETSKESARFLAGLETNDGVWCFNFIFDDSAKLSDKASQFKATLTSFSKIIDQGRAQICSVLPKPFIETPVVQPPKDMKDAVDRLIAMMDSHTRNIFTHASTAEIEAFLQVDDSPYWNEIRCWGIFGTLGGRFMDFLRSQGYRNHQDRMEAICSELKKRLMSMELRVAQDSPRKMPEGIVEALTLKSGREILIQKKSKAEAKTTNEKMMVLVCLTELDFVKDKDILKSELGEIWDWFRPQVEREGITIATIKMSEKRKWYTGSPSLSSTSCYRRNADGTWDLIPEMKRSIYLNPVFD